MTEPKKPGLSINVLRQGYLFDASRELRDALSKSEALAAQVSLIENSAISQARQSLQGHSAAIALATMAGNRAEEMNKFLNPYEDIQKALRSDAGIQAALAATKQQQCVLEAANTGLGSTLEFSGHLNHCRDIARRSDAHFRLPSIMEANQVLVSMQSNQGAMAAYAQQHISSVLSRQDWIGSFSHPWMHETESTRSIMALSELQGLGSALQSMQGFDDALTSALRVDFGDWRDKISFPRAVIDDPVARTGFYVGRGYNESLADFPDEAFEEGLALVGLDTDLQDETGLLVDDANEEAAFWRANKCHNYLQRLERRLRQFIDGAMTKQYGADWPRKRLTPQMREAWENKKSAAENNGMPFGMLIEAADFTDYVWIICRQDHWREIFQSRFYRQESVRESFQRLYPIRLATMHARFVTKDDVVFVVAESRRILNALAK